MAIESGSSSEEHWYLAKSGQRLGPVSYEGLKRLAAEGFLKKTDDVWQPAFQDWREAGSIPGLFDPPPPLRQRQAHVSTDGSPERNAAPPLEQRPTQGKPKENYFVRHWRGDLPLSVSYWVNGFVLSIVVILIIEFIAIYFRNEELSVGWVVVLLASHLVFILGFVTWLYIGIWRSADNHQKRGGRQLWAGLAKFAVIIGLIQYAIVTSKSTWPIFVESFKLFAFEDPLGKNNYRILRGGTEIEFSGGIGIGTAREFKRMLDAAPLVRVVHLDSLGGRIGEARTIGAEMKRRGLTAYVANRCISACTTIFLSGKERWLSENGRLGFHAPHFPGLGGEEMRAFIQDERDSLLSLGMPPSFVSRALTTPHTSVWFPTVQELIAAKLITGVADEKRFALSGIFAEAPTTEKLSEIMLQLPIYAAVKTVAPAVYEGTLLAMELGLQRGETMAEITERVHANLRPLLWKYLPLADDEPIIGFVEIYLEQLQRLQGRDVESCVAHLDDKKGAQLKINPSAAAKELLNKELDIYSQILLTGYRGGRRIPDTKQGEAVLTVVMERFVKSNERRAQIFIKDKIVASEYRAYCEAGIAFFREVIRLPKVQAAVALRYLFSQLGK